MTKDIQWLKNQVDELETTIKSLLDGATTHSTRITLNGSLATLKDFRGYIDQLDEPEVLSQEWIDEHKVARVNNLRKMTMSDFVPVDKLQNLLVPKQDAREQLEIAYKDILERGEFLFDDKEYVVVEKSELLGNTQQLKPVIPQFVADFLEDREGWAFFEIFDDRFLYDEHDQIARWLYDNDEHTNRERELDLALAFRRGYTVEEEQKYVIELPNITGSDERYLVQGDDGDLWIDGGLDYLQKHGLPKHTFTEEEIKSFDTKYMTFAKPVEELEE